MHDFTVKAYMALLEDLKKQGFSFLTFEEFVSNPSSNVVALRHDVDLFPRNSSHFARIQAEKGIRGTYYFRIVPESFDEKIIKEISSLGHEIGYHYEDVSLVAQRQNTKVKRKRDRSKLIVDLQDRKTARLQDKRHIEEELALIAIENFKENLAKLRVLVPVKTICMHGSPMNMWDSRLLWKYFDYHDFGIIGEPYFDVDFNKVLYLTDTGRSWDRGTVSVRDKGLGIRGKGLVEEGYKEWKVKPVFGSLMNMTPESIDFQSKYKFGSTSEIISKAERGELPDKIMMTFHPQRWTDKPIPWVRELFWQNVKNVGKYFLVKMRD
jgi:hypothetical protein